jgi:hypothetical protein
MVQEVAQGFDTGFRKRRNAFVAESRDGADGREEIKPGVDKAVHFKLK